MGINLPITMIIFALIWPVAVLRAAASKTIWADASAREFVFVEDNSGDNLFITPGGALDPRLTGASRWIDLKCTGLGAIYQQSLGCIDNDYNTGLYTNWKFDVWLGDSPVSSPLAGLRCIGWYAECNMTASLVLPQTTNASGFYGTTVTSDGAKWIHGMLSGAFYQHIQQMPVGSSFIMTINVCQASINYDTSNGTRYKDWASGNWYVRNVTHMKVASLRLIGTHLLAEVLVNSDGVPTLGEGNTDCRTQTTSSCSRLNYKVVNYILQTSGFSNISIHIFPAIVDSPLASAVGVYDMQFSLNGSSWKPVSNTAYYYTFSEMKSTDLIYVFFSSNSFRQTVNLGISNINTKDLFNFRSQSTTSPRSGRYEFSTSSTLIIKPRDFSISIISDEYTQTLSREGYVGSGESALNFGYIITTSSKTAADGVLIKVTGPAQVIGEHSYCVFSSDDGKTKVPFLAILSSITRNGATKIYDAGCNGSRRDMTDALWLTTPWADISGEVGQMNKTTVKFLIPMDNAISLCTVDNNNWFGEVNASGKAHVQATWRNTNQGPADSGPYAGGTFDTGDFGRQSDTFTAIRD